MPEPVASRNALSYLQKMGRQAGVIMHITSLPGEHGVGDIADSAIAFVDQLVEMDLGVWQILPSGPSAYADSPYQPLSAFAGNPLFIGLNPLIEMGLLKTSELSQLETLPRDRVDFRRLIPVKQALLETAAKRFLNQPALRNGADYESFLDFNGSRWLDEYAIFRVLKSVHDERPWPEWDKQFARRDPAALRKLGKDYSAEVEAIKVAQFLFAKQWEQLSNYAQSKGICLFGDMPIYVSLDSADAWSHPESLLLSKEGIPSQVAGVPPDYFSEDGQLWGNPLYDWAYHQRTGFRWWIERIKHATSQTPLVRIDHFRGFESYWAVPFGEANARNGQWVTAPGDALFDAMENVMGTLPIVAEDLGVITPEVDQLRENHNLPGMVVLQFEVGNPEFDIKAVSTNSVCYTGTHDNDTTLGWFHGSANDTRSKQETRTHQASALRHTGGKAEMIPLDMIRLAFSSKATLAMAPMQDYLGLGSEARMNVPGTTINNWGWRMLPGQLKPESMELIRKMVRKYSRDHQK